MPAYQTHLQVGGIDIIKLFFHGIIILWKEETTVSKVNCSSMMIIHTDGRTANLDNNLMPVQHPFSPKVMQTLGSMGHFLYSRVAMTWKRFSHYWPLKKGIADHKCITFTKGQYCGAPLFSWVSLWINLRVAGDLRRHNTHVTSLLWNCMFPLTSISHRVVRKTFVNIGFCCCDNFLKTKPKWN